MSLNKICSQCGSKDLEIISKHNVKNLFVGIALGAGNVLLAGDPLSSFCSLFLYYGDIPMSRKHGYFCQNCGYEEYD